MIVGNRIKVTRMASGLSPENVCKGILSRSHLSNIEKGRYFPSDEILSSLAERLKVPVEYLTSYDTNDDVVTADLDNLADLLKIELDSFFIEKEKFQKKHPVIVSFNQEVRFALLELEAYTKVKDVKRFIDLYEKTLLPLINHATITNQSVRNRLMRTKGNYYYHIGDFQKAIQHFKLLMKESTDPQEEASIFFNISLNFSKMESWYDAINFMKRAKDHFLSEHCWNDAGDAYVMLGSLFRKIDDSKRAKYYYNKALNLSKDLNLRVLESQALHNLGELEKKDSKFLYAIQYFTKSLKIKETEPFTNKSVTLVSLIETYINAGEQEEAKEMIEYSLSLAHEKYYLKQLNVLNEKLSYMDGNISNYEEILLEAVEYFNEENASELHRVYSMELGHYYFNRKKYKSASEVFKRFLK